MPKGTANTKDYSSVSGAAGTVAEYPKTSSGGYAPSPSTVRSLRSGETFYSQSGGTKYVINTVGGGTGTRETKVFLVAKNSTATQNFAFDMEE